MSYDDEVMPLAELDVIDAPSGAADGETSEQYRKRLLNLPGPDGDVLQLMQRRMVKEGDRWVEGPVICNDSNIEILLTHDRRWSGMLVWDEWFGRLSAIRGDTVHHLSDDDIQSLTNWIQQVYGLNARVAQVYGAARLAAKSSVVNEPLSYLESLTWDGVCRIDHWLEDHLLVAPHALTRVYGRRWLIQAVARAFSPGCKADSMLMVVGGQGMGKTTAARVLGGEASGRPLTVDIGAGDDVNGPETAIQMRGAWLVNIDELHAFKRSSIEGVKTWMSKTHDQYRPKYGREAESHARRCVAIGSTNKAYFLHDSTGSRRFWVVEGTKGARVDIARLRDVRDQLWAEAVARYRDGEQWWLTPEEERMQDSINERWANEGWREDDIDGLLERVRDAYNGEAPRVALAWIVEQLNEQRMVRDEKSARGHVIAHLQRRGWHPGEGKARVYGRPAASRFWTM